MSKTDLIRIERLRESLERFAGPTIREQVMAGAEQITATTTPARLAQWVGGAMDRLDALVDKPTRAQIMAHCGHLCAAEHLRQAQKLHKLYQQSQDIDAVLAAWQQGAQGFRLTREGDVVYLIYERCFCSLVKAARAPLSMTYCHCSRGFTETTWKAVLGRPVQVELLASIVAGASECKLAIHL